METINLQNWIDANRTQLKPPVGNKDIWPARDFMITVVGGPNCRKDYHINPTEEYFHQLEGEVTIKTIQEGKFIDLKLKAGEVLLLQPNTPHCPVRGPGTVGMVIEVKKEGGREDGFAWYCESCRERLWETRRRIQSIVTDFPAIFDEFYQDPAKCTCRKCGLRQVP